MKKNIGNTDATIRFALSICIAIAGFYFESWWGLLAIVPMLTAYFGFCPLYKLLGINTNKRKMKAN